jgi:hypothetical protein
VALSAAANLDDGGGIEQAVLIGRRRKVASTRVIACGGVWEGMSRLAEWRSKLPSSTVALPCRHAASVSDARSLRDARLSLRLVFRCKCRWSRPKQSAVGGRRDWS